MQNAPLPKYGRPPVTEVVCGIYFQDLSTLQVAHVGRLWDRLRQDYPRTETLPPLPPVVSAEGPSELLVQFQVGPGELNQFPRIWFVSEDGAFLVQLQRDRLVVNWRRTTEDAPYPSYEAMRGRLMSLHELFASFLREEGLGELDLVGLEIAYVNTLPFGRELVGPAEIGAVVPFLAWKAPGEASAANTLSALGWNAQLDLPGRLGHLYISLSTTQLRSDGRGAMRLDLLARRFSPAIETRGIWDWFDPAHESIVRTFADITSREVQDRVWEKSR